jgi:hypothetical protein
MKTFASTFASLGIAMVLMSGAASSAPRTIDPDWPCQQIKVSQLSVAAFWSGPPIDPAQDDWRRDDEISGLAGDISERRMPIETAEERIAEFAHRRGAGKDAALPALFTAVFDILNEERQSVISGLDRFGQRQKTLADNLREEEAALGAARATASPESTKISELSQQLAWDVQFFEARRTSLRYACEVPSVIEQRLYALSQAIQKNLP